MLNNLPLLLSVSAAILLSACGVASVENGQDLAQKIESKISLPDGAESINSYSRYYYKGKDDTVYAVYIIFPENFRTSVQRECENSKISQHPCNRKDFGIIEAGQRIWLSDRA